MTSVDWIGCERHTQLTLSSKEQAGSETMVSNIGTAVGSIVGVFAALIVGLNLLGNVFIESASLLSNGTLDDFLATSTVVGILPTVITVGLFVGGSVLGGVLGRTVGNKIDSPRAIE